MPQPKKYEGTYRGTVISKQDPKKQMRVQVRVAEIFSGIPDKYLPWATYQLPLGSRPGNGGIIPVQVGDIVWVRFDAGDSRQPIIVAAASSMPGGKPNLPDDVWQGPDSYQHKRAEGEPAPDTPGYAGIRRRCRLQTAQWLDPAHARRLHPSDAAFQRNGHRNPPGRNHPAPR